MAIKTIIDTMTIGIYGIDKEQEKIKVSRYAIVAQPANVGDDIPYARNIARAQLVTIYNRYAGIYEQAQNIIDDVCASERSVTSARKKQEQAQNIMHSVTARMKDLDIDTADMTFHHGIADVVAYVVASPMRGTATRPNYFDGAYSLYNKIVDMANKGTMSDTAMKKIVHDMLEFMDTCTADDGENPTYTREYRNKLDIATARTIVHNVGAVRREYRKKGITEKTAGIREFQKDLFCAVLKKTYKWVEHHECTAQVHDGSIVF